MGILAAIGKFFLDLMETIVMALAIFVVVYLFLFQPHQVKGNSMYPNFHDGEYILTDKISYRFGQPQKGDVVVFQAPKNKEVDYIKRIIALPGETVKIDNSSIYINNEKLEEAYIPADFVTSGGSFLTDGQEVIVPQGEYFTMGDNRSHSSDSREWGFVKKEEIVGRAFLRYWPFNRFGIIKKTIYQLTFQRSINPLDGRFNLIRFTV